MATVVFRDSALEPNAFAFIDELAANGMVPAELPDYFFSQRHMKRHLTRNSWEPDSHSISLMYWEAIDFTDLFDLATLHVEKARGLMKIYLSSTNGEEARLNQEGVAISPIR